MKAAQTGLRRAFVPRLLLAFVGSMWLAGCDASGVLTPNQDPREVLRSGEYEYNAWSDAYPGGPVWWGVLDLEVYADGEISGTYLLPDQCADEYGYTIDCVGYVGGRVYRDGEVRFGLDEGWLSHRGNVQRRSRATGHWEGRFGGYADEGTFEIVPYYY